MNLKHIEENSTILLNTRQYNLICKTKEQLKTKNRYFTAQKEFYKFNNSYYSNRINCILRLNVFLSDAPVQLYCIF